MADPIPRTRHFRPGSNAPAGIVPTAAEKELDARWNALPARLRALNYKGH